MSARVFLWIGISSLLLCYGGIAAAQESPVAPGVTEAPPPVLLAQAVVAAPGGPVYVEPPQPPMVVTQPQQVYVTPPPPPVVVSPAPQVYVNQPPPMMMGPGPGPQPYYPGDFYPRRIWGVGSVFGAGVTGGTIGTAIADPIQSGSELSSGASPSILLPTLELSFFLRRGHSINISIPITNVVVISAQIGAFYFNTDFFYNFNIGRGQVRLLLGPGLGYNVLVGGGFQMGGIRVPGEIGVEFLTRSRRFGFKIMGRPWLEFDFGTNGSASGGSVGGGVLALLGFSFYGTR